MNMKIAQKIARTKKYGLGAEAEAIINTINQRNGQCPCRIDGTTCPCPQMNNDIREHGACHCGLFVEK